MLRKTTEGIVVHRAEVIEPGSYHFLVERFGTIVRLMGQDEKGEHAIAFNGKTIGVAVFGCFASQEAGKNAFPTKEQIENVIALLRVLNAQYNKVLWVAGHSQLGPSGTSVPLKLQPGHTCPGENFPLSDVIVASGCKPFIPPVFA